jgi:anti-sigma factor RsiW
MSDDVESLLPWYVNGTLAAADRARVERELERDASLRAALAFWRQTAQSQHASAMPAAEDVGLARTLARIRAESAPAAAPRLAQPAPSLWQRLFGGTWLKPAFATALAVIVVQSGLLLAPERMQYRGAAPADTPSTDATLAARVTLRVVFDPSVTEGQLRITLAAANAWYVGGPGDAGEYWLSVAPEQANAALETLRASGVVRAAATTDGVPRPR